MKTLFTRYILLDTGETLDVPAYEGPPIEIVELQIKASLLTGADETPPFKNPNEDCPHNKRVCNKTRAFQ